MIFELCITQTIVIDTINPQKCIETIRCDCRIIKRWKQRTRMRIYQMLSQSHSNWWKYWLESVLIFVNEFLPKCLWNRLFRDTMHHARNVHLGNYTTYHWCHVLALQQPFLTWIRAHMPKIKSRPCWWYHVHSFLWLQRRGEIEWRSWDKLNLNSILQNKYMLHTLSIPERIVLQVLLN